MEKSVANGIAVAIVDPTVDHAHLRMAVRTRIYALKAGDAPACWAVFMVKLIVILQFYVIETALAILSIVIVLLVIATICNTQMWAEASD